MPAAGFLTDDDTLAIEGIPVSRPSSLAFDCLRDVILEEDVVETGLAAPMSTASRGLTDKAPVYAFAFNHFTEKAVCM